jgi:hypothetical protein
MANPSDPRPPAGKSKTDLRRGQFTPGFPAAKKNAKPQRSTAITNAEQSLLFDVSGGAK